MSINRHNYEEFFLLYADNELCAADKKAVEVFVLQNPDLAAELKTLLQTILPVTEIAFAGKNDLLKKDIPAALQENMLLLLDGELDDKEKVSLENIIATDAGLQKEWSSLLQAKLADEKVVFANKATLYRKEGGKVITLPWLRMAAAAILLGFGVWGGVKFFGSNKSNVNPSTVAKDNTTNKSTDEKKVNNSNETIAQQQPENNQPLIKEATNNNNVAALRPDNVQPKTNNTVVVKNNTTAIQLNIANKGNQTSPANETIVANKEDKPSNNLPKPLYERINKEDGNKATASNVPIITNTPTIQLNTNTQPVTNAENSSKNSYAINAAYNQTAAEEVNNNKILYMDEEKVKKTKLAGFLRKVKRMIERSTNIKSGNGIKVAGFDIAIK
jgi:hypothetical protein